MDEDIKAICVNIYDFTNDDFLHEKLEKYKKLEILCDIFSSTYADENQQSETNITVPFLLDIIDIIEVNLFRQLPPSKLPKENVNYGPSFEKLTSIDEAQMIHLDLIYKLLSMTIEFLKKEPKISNVLFDDVFVEKFIQLIESDDEEERSHVVKNVLKIYQYIPARRSIIDKIVMEKLNEVISYGPTVYAYLENLLEIYLLMMDRVHHGQDSTRINITKSLLLSLHRLPYIYYYHLPLFSCTLKFLKKYPEQIVDFTRRLLLIRSAIKNGDQTTTTNSMLTMVELNHILNLVLVQLNNDEQKSNAQCTCAELIFAQMIPYMLPLFINNLRSSNASLVKSTIKILTMFEYQTYFEKYMDNNIKMKLITVVNDRKNLIHWDYRAHVQQILYGIYLKSIPNS